MFSEPEHVNPRYKRVESVPPESRYFGLIDGRSELMQWKTKPEETRKRKQFKKFKEIKPNQLVGPWESMDVTEFLAERNPDTGVSEFRGEVNQADIASRLDTLQYLPCGMLDLYWFLLS